MAGAYMKIQPQNAINGPGLSKLKNLVGSLMELETGMHFKFSDLKGSLQRCTLKFPDLRNKVEEDKRGDFEGTLASALLCVCAHVRRLKDATRFREACSKCTDYEVEELKEMREWMSGDKSKEATWLDIWRLDSLHWNCLFFLDSLFFPKALRKGPSKEW